MESSEPCSHFPLPCIPNGLNDPRCSIQPLKVSWSSRGRTYPDEHHPLVSALIDAECERYRASSYGRTRRRLWHVGSTSHCSSPSLSRGTGIDSNTSRYSSLQPMQTIYKHLCLVGFQTLRKPFPLTILSTRLPKSRSYVTGFFCQCAAEAVGRKRLLWRPVMR
jgi:hypothetical protein